MTARPKLLILKRLLAPAERTRLLLSDINARVAAAAPDQVISKGLFVLSVSSVETMITDIMKYYLCSFPEKIDKKSLDVSKEELLAHPFDIVSVQVDKYLHSLGYKPIDEIMEDFCSTLSIDADHARMSDELREIKATRNILLHNNLVSNAAYLTTAGKTGRTEKTGVALPIDRKYLLESLETMASFVGRIADLISKKYAAYTRVAAIRSLWDFTFSSPILRFDDYWDTDEANDCIACRKAGSREALISSSEKILLDIWRAQYSGTMPGMNAFSLSVFDEINQSKVLFLFATFRTFSLQPPW